MRWAYATYCTAHHVLPASGLVPHDSSIRAVLTVLESIKQSLMTDVIAEVTHKDMAVA